MNDKNCPATTYFSRPVTEALKGYLALGVLMHHIYLNTHIIDHDSVLGFFFGSLGAYCVCLFFFISGYGLFTSFNNRGGYLRNYQRNRVLPLFCVNALLVVIYAIQKTMLGIDVTPVNLLLSFFYGGDIVTYGWYLLVIMLFYEFFYVGARWFKNHICLAVSALTLLYIGIAMILKMHSWWYMSSLAFPCGLLFAHYKEKWDASPRSYRFAFMLAATVLYLCCFVCLYLAGDATSGIHQLPCFRMLRRCFTAFHGVSLCFLTVGVLMLLGNKVKTDAAVTRRLSSLYLEIYVMQGFAFYMVQYAWGIDNDYLVAGSIFVLTLLLASAIHPLFKKIISVVKVPQDITVTK